MQAAGQLPTRVLGLMPTANIAAQYPMAGGYFTRQARRLYIGGVPFGATEEVRFFIRTHRNKKLGNDGIFQSTNAYGWPGHWTW